MTRVKTSSRPVELFGLAFARTWRGRAELLHERDQIRPVALERCAIAQVEPIEGQIFDTVHHRGSGARQEAAAQCPGVIGKPQVDARRLDALGMDPEIARGDPALLDRLPKTLAREHAGHRSRPRLGGASRSARLSCLSSLPSRAVAGSTHRGTRPGRPSCRRPHRRTSRTLRGRPPVADRSSRKPPEGGHPRSALACPSARKPMRSAGLRSRIEARIRTSTMTRASSPQRTECSVWKRWMDREPQATCAAYPTSHSCPQSYSRPATVCLIAACLPPRTRSRSVLWFWGSEEGGECAAGLVGGVEVAEVGVEAAVL